MTRDADTTASVPVARRATSAGRSHRRRGRAQRSVGVVAVIIAVAIKAEAYRHVIEHRAGLIPFFAVALAISILRPRPLAAALAAGPLIALALDPHPVLAGIGLALGACALLIALCFVVAALLHARQGAPGRRAARLHRPA